VASRGRGHPNICQTGSGPLCPVSDWQAHPAIACDRHSTSDAALLAQRLSWQRATGVARSSIQVGTVPVYSTREHAGSPISLVLGCCQADPVFRVWRQRRAGAGWRLTTPAY
jgi:hypothetical protein